MNTGKPRARGRPAKDLQVAPEQLLRQVFRMFAREGYEGASLRMLAADAGVNYTLFRHHFGTKDALWRAAVESEMAPLVRQLSQILDGSREPEDLIAALRKNITAVLTLVASNPEPAGVLLKDSTDDERCQWLYEHFLGPYLNRVEQAYEEARELQLIREVPFDSLHGMVMGVARMMVDPGPLAPRMKPILEDPEKLRAYIEGTVATLFDGLAL